jgi:hypothetical protein
MLADIVLDTNVLLHADNDQEPLQRVSRELLVQMTSCPTHLCVDEGFDVIEANNRSIIGGEYLRHLRFGMVGFALVRHLAVSLRVRQVSKNVAQNVSKQIAMQVPKGPDRVFLKVAFNSESKTVVCHDFNDVPDTVRKRLNDRIGLQIIDAEAAAMALAPVDDRDCRDA